MKFSRIAFLAAAMLSIASSCFAIESGVYNRLVGEHLFRVTVLTREGTLKNSERAHLEFVALENSVQEAYNSVLLRTSDKTYATTSGFVTNADSEKGRNVNGYLKGLQVGYDRMETREGDFTIEDLGQGKIKVSSNVGYVKGFGFDGVYEKEETFIEAPAGLALHALEVIAKKTQYLAIGDIKYDYRVLQKQDGTGYTIQAYQQGAEPAYFDVNISLCSFNFYWNDKPINLFSIDGWKK